MKKTQKNGGGDESATYTKASEMRQFCKISDLGVWSLGKSFLQVFSNFIFYSPEKLVCFLITSKPPVKVDLFKIKPLLADKQKNAINIFVLILKKQQQKINEIPHYQKNVQEKI